MAALRQLLNARDMQGANYPRALPEESRQMVKAKMEAIGYPISQQPPAVPEKEEQSKKGDYDPEQSLKPVRYQENSQRKYEPESEPDNYDRSTYTSMYEQRLSQDISSALSNHLAMRPRNVRNNSETNINKTTYEHRRRSRSAVEDGIYDSANGWNDYKSRQPPRRPPRADSRSTSQPLRHFREGSEPISENFQRGQMSMSPEMDNVSQKSSSSFVRRHFSTTSHRQGAFQPLTQIGHNNKPRPKKHTNNHSTDTGPSPTNSVGSGVKHTQPASIEPLERSKKRPLHNQDDSEDLDHPLPQLLQKSYADLALESFDQNPPSFFAENTLIKRLPPSDLPLPARLQAVYDTSTNRIGIAKTLFASLTIDKYEECGDVLLQKFAEVVARLKEARVVKRKACRAMEEEVRVREMWVGRKRQCVEDGLGRLRTTGMSVVRPGGKG